MATNNQLLYTQSFTGTSVTVTHNLDRYNLDARVIVDGVSRPDLINGVEFTTGDERNEFVMGLVSNNTGIIQLLDTTKYPINLPSPERINIGSQVGFISGTTLNGDILELNRTGGHPNLTTDLSTIDNDRYVTGATLNSTTLEIGRNGGLSAVTADLSSIDGTVTRVDGVGSVNGLTLGGSITTNGDLTLGGTLSINNDDWSGTDLSIVNGGTGQGTAQNAINSLSQVSSATNEHVLTKDTSTGNATWKAGGGGGTDTFVTGATLNSTTLELERNGGLADVTVDLAPILGPLKIINLTSTDTSSTFTRASPLICPWDTETYKDAGFTHSTSIANTKITIVDDGTYQIAASIRIYDTTNQRAQTVAKILINGSALPQLFGSAYIRNSGNSSEYWSCVVNPPPIKLSAGDEVEVQIQGESQASSSFSSIFQGDESSFSIIKLDGVKGSKGDSGSLTGNTGVYSDTFSGLTTTAVYYGDGSNLTGIAAIFGSQYYSDETLAEADTTNTSAGSNTSNPRADITTSTIPSGTYRIGWSLEWKASDEDQRWNGRVRVDNTTNIMEMASEPAKENRDEWRAIGGFGNQTFGSSDTHTVEMDWWTENSAGTAYIRKARIEFWRVS